MQRMKYLVWLTTQLKFSPSASEYLKKFTAEEIYAMNWDTIEKNGLPDSLATKSLDRTERIIEICRAKRIDIIPCPEILRDIKGMPPVLYVKGNIDVLNDGLRVGIVGTRKCTQYGKAVTERLTETLCENGCVIISGGAAGIDTAALATAVLRGKACVAVLGCDIDRYYPAENYSLIKLIAERGAVISEYPPETNARYFPNRNRIIAALSERLVVCEAPEKSGALITAKYASDYAVPVFACPQLAGGRELIERGAYAADGYLSVAEAKTPVRLKPVARKREEKPSHEEKIHVKKYGIPVNDYLLECILEGRDSLSDMLRGGKFQIREILQALTVLELDGVITATSGDRYRIIGIKE